MEAMKACQSTPRRARKRNIPASRIEVPSMKRLRVKVDVGAVERKSLKIDTLLFDYQRALHNLRVNRADIFTHNAEKK